MNYREGIQRKDWTKKKNLKESKEFFVGSKTWQGYDVYMIEDGKITYPIKGATLIGSGQDTLLKIDMVANNRSFGYGMCGSRSGSIPACVGQPTIRVRNMTVGGKGSK